MLQASLRDSASFFSFVAHGLMDWEAAAPQAPGLLREARRLLRAGGAFWDHEGASWFSSDLAPHCYVGLFISASMDPPQQGSQPSGSQFGIFPGDAAARAFGGLRKDAARAVAEFPIRGSKRWEHFPWCLLGLAQVSAAASCRTPGRRHLVTAVLCGSIPLWWPRCE